jgi:hypothetical protein
VDELRRWYVLHGLLVFNPVLFNLSVPGISEDLVLRLATLPFVFCIPSLGDDPTALALAPDPPSSITFELLSTKSRFHSL